MIPGAIYARQSVTREDSESRDLQVERCMEAATRLGIEVIETLVEPPSTSGFKNRGKDREKFKDLLDLIRKGEVRSVLSYKMDRLSRGGGPGWAPLWDAFEAAGIDLDHAIATPNGWMSEMEIGYRAIADREESKKISERSKDNHARAAKLGKPRGGGKRPFGYQRDLVTIDIDEAMLIREAAKRVLAGESAWGIARDWNAQEIPTGSGGHWGSQTLKRVLCSDRVAGLRNHQGAVTEATWTAILDREIWEQVKTAIEAHPYNGRTGAGGGRARSFLLNGFIYCGRCGNRMHTRTRNGGRREYTCQSPESSGQADSCNGCVIHADPVEADVFESVVIPPVVSGDWAAFVSSVVGDDGDDDIITRTINEIEAKQQRLKDLYVDGEVSRADYNRRAEALTDERDRIHRKLAGQTIGRLLSTIPTDEPGLRDAWATRGLDWQRSVLSLFLERVQVRPGRAAKPADRLTYVDR